MSFTLREPLKQIQIQFFFIVPGVSFGDVLCSPPSSHSIQVISRFFISKMNCQKQMSSFGCFSPLVQIMSGINNINPMFTFVNIHSGRLFWWGLLSGCSDCCRFLTNVGFLLKATMSTGKDWEWFVNDNEKNFLWKKAGKQFGDNGDGMLSLQFYHHVIVWASLPHPDQYDWREHMWSQLATCNLPYSTDSCFHPLVFVFVNWVGGGNP